MVSVSRGLFGSDCCGGASLISRTVHDGLVPQPRADSLPATALQRSSTLVPLYRQWMQKSQSETTLAPLQQSSSDCPQPSQYLIGLIVCRWELS
jgi:hypothetical protein